MKQAIIFCLLACIGISSFTSCNNCKECRASAMGVESPSQKLCGDDLKRAQENPGIICE